MLALVASLLFQAFAFAQAVPDIEAAVHASSHVGAPHHHDSDGSTQYDPSDESLQHVLGDHGGSVALAIASAPPVAHVLPHRGPDLRAPPAPPPDFFNEGTRRPPRLAS